MVFIFEIWVNADQLKGCSDMKSQETIRNLTDLVIRMCDGNTSFLGTSEWSRLIVTINGS